MTRRRNSAQPVIKETFTLYTPESVEAGDAAESGWIDEEGVDMTPDEYDVEEGVTAVDKAVKHLRSEGASEPSSSFHHKGVWYCSMHEPDFRTGEQEERCFHLHGFSPEEEHSIFQQMAARRRSNPRSQRLPRAATRDVTIPVCEACRDAMHFAGEPDFPWHPAAAGEVCGAADHDHDHDHDTSAADADAALAARAAYRAADAPHHGRRMNPPLSEHMAHDDIYEIAESLAARFVRHPAGFIPFLRQLFFQVDMQVHHNVKPGSDLAELRSEARLLDNTARREFPYVSRADNP